MYFLGRRLEFNDEITYKQSFASGRNDPQVENQKEESDPYTAKIVDFSEHSIGVRADGFNGQSPLYYVYPSDIISVVPASQE